MQTPVYIPCTYKRREPVGPATRSGIITPTGWEDREVRGIIVAFVGVGSNSEAWGPMHSVLAVVVQENGGLRQMELKDLTVEPEADLAPAEVA